VHLGRDTPFGREVAEIKDGLVRLNNGGLRVIVSTSSLNFAGLAPEQQLRAVQAFRELLHGQSGPLELYVRIRRVPAGDTREPAAEQQADRRAYLGALTKSFVNAHLLETPVYQRQVFVVLSSADGPRTLLRSWSFRFDRSADQPTRVATDRGRPLQERALGLIEHLRRMGLKAEIASDRELDGRFDGLYGRPWHAVAPAVFVHRANSVELSGRHYASFIVDRYPGEEVEPGWLLPLLSFNGELHAGLHILPLETDRTLARLHHRIQDLRADDMAAVETGSVPKTTLGALPDALSMHQALVRNEEKAFAVSFYLTVGASDQIELRTQTQAIQASCRRLMLRAIQPFFQMQQGLLASWPLGMDLIGREKILPTSAVATLIPWLQEDLADPDGHYWGYNKETGGLCVFDPFDETRFSNANIAVLAHSLAGKSYAAASVVLSGHTRGIGAILLDPEAEYGGLVRELGGAYFHLAAGSGHAINALDPVLFGSDAEEHADHLNHVLDLIGLMCGRLDELERAQVEQVTKETIAGSAETPVLADVWSALNRAHPGSRPATILRRWVTGDLGRLFSAQTNVDLRAEIVGFNLRNLSEELIAPAYLLVANWLWAALRRDRRPRHLLIDEVGLLLEHEPIRRFLVRLARRIRKYGGSLILVSQNPGDFFDTKDGSVLATNPSILLLGSQKHSEALKLQKAYNLTDRQVNYLETAARGDFLLVAGPNRVPVHIMAPPWMDELIVKSRGH